MLVVGLTGNIACGKSSLSKILKDNCFDIIDADLISRDIMDNKNLLKKIFCFNIQGIFILLIILLKFV